MENRIKAHRGRGLLDQPAALAGIVFFRKSPERLVYSRERLLSAIALACIAAYFAHVTLLGLDTPRALVKLVCELGVLVVGIRLAYSNQPDRYRVLVMTMTLFLISLTGDLVLVALSFIPFDATFGTVRQFVVFLVMVVMFAGASNTVQFGLRVGWRRAVIYVTVYVALALLMFETASLAFNN